MTQIRLESIKEMMPIIFKIKDKFGVNHEFGSYIRQIVDEIEDGYRDFRLAWHPTGIGDMAMELWVNGNGTCTLNDRWANDDAMDGKIKFDERGFLLVILERK